LSPETGVELSEDEKGRDEEYAKGDDEAKILWIGKVLGD
jgi:hypothetical protein